MIWHFLIHQSKRDSIRSDFACLVHRQLDERRVVWEQLAIHVVAITILVSRDLELEASFSSHCGFGSDWECVVVSSMGHSRDALQSWNSRA